MLLVFNSINMRHSAVVVNVTIYPEGTETTQDIEGMLQIISNTEHGGNRIPYTKETGSRPHVIVRQFELYDIITFAHYTKAHYHFNKKFSFPKTFSHEDMFKRAVSRIPSY